MISRDQADRLRETLLAVLAEDAHNTQRLLARLDSISQESGIGAYAALLLILTRLAFEESEARGHWEAILEHRQVLSQQLRRDTGVRMAILDYFMNINRKLIQPSLIDLEMVETVAQDATRDRLSGLSTDYVFRTSLQHELRRARRYSQKATLVLFDLDNFAQANDKFGTLIGDRLIRESALLMSNKIRDIDMASRPGEDEFALLLPETDRNGALLVAERFRREFEEYFAQRESMGRPVMLTVSGGFACYPDDATTAEGLLEAAAQALYQAKASGKNTVRSYQPERRRFLRFELEPGQFEIEVLAPASLATIHPRNLSRSGVLFTSPAALQVGEQIEIRLAGRADDPTVRGVRLRGQVVRLEELPQSIPVSARGRDADPAADDLYEIGMAFDLDWADGTRELLEFLEKTQQRALGNEP